MTKRRAAFDAPAGRGGPWLLLAAVMAAFAASRVAIAGIPTEREYDEGVYLVSARALARGYALFSDVFSSQPPAFLETLALAFRVAGDRLETGRYLIVGFSMLALAAVADIARRIAGAWAAPAAAAALALSMTFCDLGHFVQAETPAVAVSLAAIAACFGARRRGWHSGWLAASGALLALALLYKLIVVPFVAPFAALLLLAPAGREESDWCFDPRGVIRRALTVAAGAGSILAVPLLLYDATLLFDQTIALHLAKREAYELLAGANLRRILNHFAADWPMAWSAAAGVVLLAWRRHRLAAAWLATWLVLMVAAIAGQTPLFWRHFVLLLPPIAIAAGAAVGLLAAYTPRAQWAPAVAIVALWTIATPLATKGMFPHLVDTTKHERARAATLLTAGWVEENTHAEEMVGGDDPLVVYLAGRVTPPALCDTSGARITSGSLQLEEAGRESLSARVIVMRSDGRLSKLRGFRQWLAANYEPQPPHLTAVGRGRTIWIRKAPPTPPRSAAAGS